MENECSALPVPYNRRRVGPCSSPNSAARFHWLRSSSGAAQAVRPQAFESSQRLALQRASKVPSHKEVKSSEEEKQLMFALHVAGILNHVPAAATWIVQEGGGAMATD